MFLPAPPLKLFGIPGRYANATYIAASKQGTLDQVETELLSFKEVRWKRSSPHVGPCPRSGGRVVLSIEQAPSLPPVLAPVT